MAALQRQFENSVQKLLISDSVYEFSKKIISKKMRISEDMNNEMGMGNNRFTEQSQLLS